MTRPTAVRLAGPAFAAVLVLAALAAPTTALGADPGSDDPLTGETPTVVPHSTEAPTDGEIVYDGPFVEPTDDAPPAADQPGEGAETPGRPAVTPPATDTVRTAPQPRSGGLELLLATLLGIVVGGPVAGRKARARRS